jgi:hypothetical protein
MLNIPVIDSNLIRSVEWQGDPFQYDYQLSKLGNGANNFIIPNPNVLVNLDRIVNRIPDTVRCIVWKCNGEWLAKKFHKNWNPNQGYLDIEVPEKLLIIDIDDMKIEVNPALPGAEYDINYIIPWTDYKYEHMWMLDKKHTENLSEEIWTVKVQPSKEITGTKLMGYISPKITTLVNPDLPKMKIDIDYDIQYHDFEYEHVWYVDETEDKIWAFKIKTVDNPIGEKDMGAIVSSINDRLDVIFISYNEPNAEDNWKKVLARAPWAQRIHGVAGIFNAHKAAAKLSKTDMFFVVDGDADLADDWNFDFQPSIFDRNCAYVWASRNPVNDLIYGYGGVKLFPKSILMKKRKWNTLDMFTGLMKEIKVNDAISCTTNFNSDEFSTWRSAFRECVKLYTTSQMTKLTAWLESDITKPFGKYAVDGARAGYEYAKKNKDNQENLLKINDYDWLSNYFEKVIE